MDPLILDLLFQNFDVATLKTCRLVCKEWYEVSLTEWRKRAVVCIGNVSGSPLTPPCARIPGRAKLSLKKWNKLWARKDGRDLLRLREVPYRRIKIWDWSEWGVAETIFIKQTGPSIRQLDFVNCDFPEVPRSFRGVLDDVTQFMRQCGLSIRNLRFEESGFQGLTRSFSWPQFVRVTDLRELSLPKMSLTSFISILETIKEIRSGDDEKFPLRRLSLSIHTDRLELLPKHARRIFEEMKWPLKQVNIEYEYSTEVDEIILEPHRNTLEIIKVAEPSTTFGWLSNVVFPSLKKLELTWLAYVPDLMLTFLKRMPNLKELIIKFDLPMDEDSSDILCWIVPNTVDRNPEMATLTFPNVESLHFASWNQGVFDSPSVAQIVTWMPNLKRLTIPVAGSSLSIIFANLEQLEELKTLVYSTEDIDDFESFFTGYSSIPNEDGIHAKIAPGISDMTNLVTFSLVQPFPQSWTDFCFSHGFLKMPRLQNIFITVDDDTQFSDEMRSRILQTYPGAIIGNPKTNFDPHVEVLCEYTHNFVDVNGEGSRCCPLCEHRCENCRTH